MRKALLIIDRGSKELEVQDELLKISNQAKEKEAISIQISVSWKSSHHILMKELEIV